MKNLNFVAGMTRRFVSAKRLIGYFSNSSKLVEHRAQSPVRKVKMLPRNNTDVTQCEKLPYSIFKTKRSTELKRELKTGQQEYL